MDHLKCACILLLVGNSLQSDCPDHCLCTPRSLVCSKDLPSFVPENISTVTVSELPVENQALNFSQSDWGGIKQLFLSFGSAFNQTDLQTVRKLNDYEFTGLDHLKHLKVLCNCQLELSNRAFFGLENVKVMDLSNNKVRSIQNIVKGLLGSKILPNVSELYLSNITYWMLKVDDLDLCELDYAMENKPLKVLDLSGTGIRFSNLDTDLCPVLPQVEILNISKADRTVFSFPYMKRDATTENNFFPNLQVLDASYPRFPTSEADCELDEVYWQFCLDKYSDMYKILPHNVKELSVRNFFKTEIELRGKANSTHFCLTNKFFDKNTSFCVTGRMDHLEKLDISDSFISYIDPDLLHPLVRLKYLSLAKNQLGKAVSNEHYAKSFFKALQKTEVLNMSSNGLTVIPKRSLRNNRYLRKLDLSYNNLKNIDFGIKDLISLEFLDIKSNKITSVGLDSCKTLKKLYFREDGNHTSNISHEDTHTNIDFRGNPFSCLCENVCFLTFIAELNVIETYTCVLDNKIKVIDDLVARKALFMCKEYIVHIVFAILGAFTMVLISITTFYVIKERGKLRFKRLKEMGIENYERACKKHVVFLSFSGDDEEFVMRNVYPNLNSGLKKILNTESDCVATGGTHFRPGYSIQNEIVRCMDESAVVIFFLSDNFVTKQWCRREVHKAFCDEKPIILMLSEKVKPKSMPKVLRKHYETFTRVHWSVENGEPVMRPDWEHLCQTVVGLIGRKEE